MAPVSENPTAQGSHWVAPVTLLLLLGVLVVSVGAEGSLGLSPLAWYGLIAYVSLRERKHRWVPTVFVPATLVFGLWFLRATTGVFLPFLVGLLLAYLLDPIIDRLEPRMGRGRAIALVAAPVALGSVLAIILLVPRLVSELAQLVGKIPDLTETGERIYSWLTARTTALGFDLNLDRERLNAMLQNNLEEVAGAAGDVTTTLLRGLQGALSVLSFLVVTPVVTFYLLRDFDRLRAAVLRGMPEHKRENVRQFFTKVDQSVSGYLRGQLVVGLVVGVLFFVGLTTLGIDYALVVGLAAVVLNLIPYVGSAVTAVLALTVALLTEPTLASVLKVAALYGGVQLVDGALLSPRVMGQSLDLHPVIVMLALLIGGQFFGLAGLIMAVPAVATLKEGFATWTTEVLALLPGVERTDEGEAT